jgi:hypothetical protein
MNFLHTFETRDVTVSVELKYCERCGGLWLRERGREVVYCGGCRVQIAALLRGRQGRRPEPHGTPNPVWIDCLLGVAETEVRS